MMANPAYNGFSTPEDVYKIFKVMTNYAGSVSQQPQQMQPQVQPQYTTAMYNPYMNVQNNGQFGVCNNQMFNYGGYMGYNPYGGYRQPWSILWLVSQLIKLYCNLMDKQIL